MHDRTTSPFAIGERVTIHTSQAGPQTVTTVRRLTREGRCLELADGSEWRIDGKRQWGFRGSFYKGPWVEPLAEGDEDHVAKRRAIGRIRKFAENLTMDSPLSAEALHRVLDAIDNEVTKSE